MADTPIDSANQLLNAFVHRKKTRDNTIALNAQRLVNLFRQLSVFKPEFVAEYNKMLLSSSDEVRMMMKDIVGGPTVRQYLDYLQAKSEQLVDEDENAEENAQTISALNSNTGYLPDPDDDKPFVMAQGQTGTEIIADVSQSDVIVQMLKMFQENNQKQIETLTETLKEIKNQFKNVSDTAQRNQPSGNVITTQDFMHFQEAQQTAFEQLVRMQNELLSAITTQFAKSLAQQEQIIAKGPDEDQPRQVGAENAFAEIETQAEEALIDTGISETNGDMYEEKTVAIDEAIRESDEEKPEVAEFESVSQVVEDTDEEEENEEDIEPSPIMSTEDMPETEMERVESETEADDFEREENEIFETEGIEPEAESNEVETSQEESDEDIVEIENVESETEVDEVETNEEVFDESTSEIENVEPDDIEDGIEKEEMPEVEAVATGNEIEIQKVDQETELIAEAEENSSVGEESIPTVSLSPIPDIPLLLRPVVEQTEGEELEEAEQLDTSEMSEIEHEPVSERTVESQPVGQVTLKTPQPGILGNSIPPIPSIPHMGMPFGRHTPSAAGMPRPVPHILILPHAPAIERKPIPTPMPSAGLSQNKKGIEQTTKQDSSTKPAEENIEILNDIEL